MSDIRKFATNLENNGVFYDVVLYSDHTAAMEDKQITIEDLSMLIRMMITKHRRGKLDEEYCQKAMSYLERKGLQGNIIRALAATEPPNYYPSTQAVHGVTNLRGPLVLKHGPECSGCQGVAEQVRQAKRAVAEAKETK